MGQTEVTQSQWQKVMKNNPSSFSATGKDAERVANVETGNFPVEAVGWNEAAEFCQNLTKTGRDAGWLPQGLEIRLPTEAEWEYACRAGTDTSYSFGNREAQLVDYEWYHENGSSLPHPVGQKKPNPWGLYDMHGNVAEWSADWDGARSNGASTDPRGPSSGTLRVLRGGSWFNFAAFCRSASRWAHPQDHRAPALGFRVVLSSVARDSSKSSKPTPAKMVTAGQSETSKEDAGEHIITKDLEGQSGAVWSASKISFSENFKISAEIFLGSKDDGADGLALVFQAKDNSLVAGGSGIGYQGVSPSIAIEFDTYQNREDNNDPEGDHVGLRTDGNPAHTAGDAVDVGNLEDGKYHPIVFEWNAAQKTLNLTLDGKPIFKDKPLPDNKLIGQPAFFGFTAATGLYSNLHKVRSISVYLHLRRPNGQGDAQRKGWKCGARFHTPKWSTRAFRMEGSRFCQGQILCRRKTR